MVNMQPMDVSQFDWLTGAFEPFLEEPLPESFFAGFDPPRSEPPVYLDDEERYGELPERIDPQTGYLEERR